LNAPQGIRFSETDAETPIEYFVAVRGGSSIEIEPVEASEILHIKLGVDSNAARGIPLLTPVIARLKQYDNWLQSLLALHSVRSAVALVKRYVSSSPSDILSQASRSATTTANADGRTTRRQKLQPGSIIHASAGVEYQMLSPNIQATDADVLGRAILLSVASGLGLSETMLTADSNNANYASSVVAETPAFMAFRAHQRRFCARAAMIYRWAIENAVATGRLNAVLPDDPYVVHISASPMPTRDIESRVRAACELYDRGLLDKDETLQKTNF
jgi:capsid protein